MKDDVLGVWKEPKRESMVGLCITQPWNLFPLFFFWIVDWWQHPDPGLRTGTVLFSFLFLFFFFSPLVDWGLGGRISHFSPRQSSSTRSQDVVPRRAALPQSEQRSPCSGEVGTRRLTGRQHDGPLRRLRAAHPGPVPAQRAGQSLACQVRPVLRMQLQPDREVLLPGRKALLQNGLFQVTRRKTGIGWEDIYIFSLFIFLFA